MKRFHAIITGRVTGVGFRYKTMEIAKELDLKGFVQNIAGENVEIVAEGEDKKLEEFKNRLEQEYSANIISFGVDYEDPTGEFQKFSIVRGPVRD